MTVIQGLYTQSYRRHHHVEATMRLITVPAAIVAFGLPLALLMDRLSRAAAVRLHEAAARELGPMQVSADIGCHSFATLPPFDIGGSIMGYGLGAAAARPSTFPTGGARCR